MAYIIEREGNVLRFTINRPEIRNAVNTEVMEGLEQFALEVNGDPSIQFAVITGQGSQAFCSGGDLSIFHGLHTREEAYPMLDRMARALYGLAALPVPVIALVNGHAVGGGCEIATACDFRIVSTKAKCGFIQGTLAITTGWGGGNYLFERLPRQDRALQMLCGARPLADEELQEVGWATQLYDGEKEVALELFLESLKLAGTSVHRSYKQMLIRRWDSQNLLGRIQEEVKACSILWESAEHHEAVQNFLNKRK